MALDVGIHNVSAHGLLVHACALRSVGRIGAFLAAEFVGDCTLLVSHRNDGVTDTRTKRGKALMPAGAVLWAWDADPDFGEVAGEKWLILLPNKWNPTTATVNGWRYDPRELSSAPVRDDARRRGGTRMDE